MKNGFIVALAWPETKCKQTGAWYEPLMRRTGFNVNGYYTVGHAALVLISDKMGVCEYFDFGRYHAPNGFGRVRDQETDHDLKIHSMAEISEDKMTIVNIYEILNELSQNKSCHGDGSMVASFSRINFDNAYSFAKKLQCVDFVPYGPFIPQGTNCSRFVNHVICAGKPSFVVTLLLKFPYTISPTPMSNIKSLKSGRFEVKKSSEPIVNFPLQLASKSC